MFLLDTEVLQDFKTNLTLLDEIIYAIATVINPVTITHKQNSFKQLKWRIGMQKETEESIVDEMSKDVKMKAREIKKKCEITLTDKILIIKEKLKQKILLNKKEKRQ